MGWFIGFCTDFDELLNIFHRVHADFTVWWFMTPLDRHRKACEEEIKESEEPEDQRRTPRRPPRTDEAPSTHYKRNCGGRTLFGITSDLLLRYAHPRAKNARLPVIP